VLFFLSRVKGTGGRWIVLPPAGLFSGAADCSFSGSGLLSQKETLYRVPLFRPIKVLLGFGRHSILPPFLARPRSRRPSIKGASSDSEALSRGRAEVVELGEARANSLLSRVNWNHFFSTSASLLSLKDVFLLPRQSVFFHSTSRPGANVKAAFSIGRYKAIFFAARLPGAIPCSLSRLFLTSPHERKRHFWCPFF